jgi:hypothetical protein
MSDISPQLSRWQKFPQNQGRNLGHLHCTQHWWLSLSRRDDNRLDSDWVDQKHDLHRNRIGWKIASAPTNEISYTCTTYRVLGVRQVCKNGLKINESGFNRTTKEKNSVTTVSAKPDLKPLVLLPSLTKKKASHPHSSVHHSFFHNILY